MNLSGAQFEMFWKQYDMWEEDCYMWEEDCYSAVLDPVNPAWFENPALSQADGYVDPGCWRCGKLESDHTYLEGISYCDEFEEYGDGTFWTDPMRTYMAAPNEPLYSDEAERI